MHKKKILIIAPYAFGYTKHIKIALDRFEYIKAELIYLDKPSFKYKNKLHRSLNFFYKILGKNLKKQFVFDRIKSKVENLGSLDTIFIIRPDLLNDKTLAFLRNHTQKFIAYYYDSTRRFPRKKEITSFFNEVYSYDRIDVYNYGYKFLTNYIFEESNRNKWDYLFFNISTYDYRFAMLESLASYLKTNNWNYVIEVYNGSLIPSENIKIITDQKSIKEVSDLIKAAKIIVEIQREEQVGLSFRVFEALGHRKKLITTNKNISSYDFYDPQNILIVDPENIKIPESFVKSDYKHISEKILQKYRIDFWVINVFNL